MSTGFGAYCLYIAVKKIHFGNKKGNVVLYKKNSLKNKLIDNWNNKRRHKDGRFFQVIEEKYSSSKVLKLLFASYHLNDSNFYVRDILDDNYQIFKDNLYELKNIEEVFTTALESVIIDCIKEKKKIKNLLVSDNSIPEIFNLGLSFNVLVILNNLFNIIEINKDNKLNLLEEERWTSLKINIIKYDLLIEEIYKKYNWEIKLKKLLRETT